MQFDQRRQRILHQGDTGNGPVLYWTSRDQRVHDNWALLFAQQYAIECRKPLEIVFCLIPDYPGANRRHYSFMINGLVELQRESNRYTIPFHLLATEPREAPVRKNSLQS